MLINQAIYGLLAIFIYFHLKVTAVDRDLGMNGDLDYSIYGGGDSGASIGDLFDIDRKTGVISVKQALDDKGMLLK